MARPFIVSDGRPLCRVPGCTAPVGLSCKYVLTDGTVRTSYRRWCSWHARNPHTTTNPAFESLPEEAQCQVPDCRRKAREYRTTPEAAHRPRLSRDPAKKKASKAAQREWDETYGPPHLLPGEHRYARTCSIHTLKDVPGYVSTAPLLAAREAVRIDQLAHADWADEYETRGAKARPLEYFRKRAARTVAQLKAQK